MESIIAREVAEKEVLGWLDYKKISSKKRQNEARDGHSDEVEELIEAVSDGVLSIDTETAVITHKLKFGLNFDGGDGVALTELKYKARLNVDQVNTHMKGVKATDADGRVLAYKTALTGEPKAYLKKLDSVDNSIANAIVLFFL